MQAFSVPANVKIAFWYEDSINKNGPDYDKNKQYVEQYKDYVDQYFITTDVNNIETSIPKKKLNFIPVPASSLSENLNLLGLDQDQLIILSMLCGTDFNIGGIKGIGPKKGLVLIKKYENFVTTDVNNKI